MRRILLAIGGVIAAAAIMFLGLLIGLSRDTTSAVQQVQQPAAQSAVQTTTPTRRPANTRTPTRTSTPTPTPGLALLCVPVVEGLLCEQVTPQPPAVTNTPLMERTVTTPTATSARTPAGTPSTIATTKSTSSPTQATNVGVPTSSGCASCQIIIVVCQTCPPQAVSPTGTATMVATFTPTRTPTPTAMATSTATPVLCIYMCIPSFPTTPPAEPSVPTDCVQYYPGSPPVSISGLSTQLRDYLPEAIRLGQATLVPCPGK